MPINEIILTGLCGVLFVLFEDWLLCFKVAKKALVMWLAYRKTMDGMWICNWTCGFKDWDIGRVSEHEADVHCNKKGR